MIVVGTAFSGGSADDVAFRANTEAATSAVVATVSVSIFGSIGVSVDNTNASDLAIRLLLGDVDSVVSHDSTLFSLGVSTIGNSSIRTTVTLVACFLSSSTPATGGTSLTTETNAATEDIDTTEVATTVATKSVAVAETRATVAETRATVAETRAAVAETRATVDTSASSKISTSDTVRSARSSSAESTVMGGGGTVGAGTTVRVTRTVGGADTVVLIVIRLEGNGVTTVTTKTVNTDLGDLAIRLGLNAVDGSVASSSGDTVASGNTVGVTTVGSVGVSGFVLDDVLDDFLGFMLGLGSPCVGNGNGSCGSDDCLEHFYIFV